MESLFANLKEKKKEYVDGNVAALRSTIDSSVAEASVVSTDALSQAMEQYEDKLGTAKVGDELY
jgi:hypothetical protein